MKICCIAGSLQVGGAPRQLLNLAYYFQQKNHSFDLIFGNGGNDFTDEYSSVLNELSITCLTDKNIVMSKVQLLIRLPQILFRLYRYTKHTRYDVFLGGHEFYSFYLSVFLAFVYHKKNMLLVQNNLSKSLLEMNIISRCIHVALLRFSLQHSHKIICVSKGLAGSLKRDYHINPKKIEVIYDGLNLESIKDARKDTMILRQMGVNKKDKIVMSCGRLVPNKDHDLLIRSFANVVEMLPEAKLFIIGKGGLQKVLTSLILDLGLTKNVFLLGYVKNQYSVLKTGDIFVFSSSFEGFGMVLIEAMACGLPVISIDCQYGPREIIKDHYIPYRVPVGAKYQYEKYGVLVSNSKEEILKQEWLSEAIVDLLKSNKKKTDYKKQVLKRANDFTVDSMGRQYLSLMKNVLK